MLAVMMCDRNFNCSVGCVGGCNRLKGQRDHTRGGVFVLTESTEPRLLDYLSFIGRIIGVAVRHGMQLGVSLPRSFWKALVGLRLVPADVASFDREAYDALAKLPETDMVRVPNGCDTPSWCVARCGHQSGVSCSADGHRVVEAHGV